MYCKREIFDYSVDFTETRATWRPLSEQIFSMDQDKKQRFLEIIRCSAYLSKDRQIDNFLAQNNIYKDRTKKKKEMREQSKQLLGISDNRKISFPMYNILLHKVQRDKLNGRAVYRRIRSRRARNSNSRRSFGSMNRSSMVKVSFKDGDQNNLKDPNKLSGVLE